MHEMDYKYDEASGRSIHNDISNKTYGKLFAKDTCNVERSPGFATCPSGGSHGYVNSVCNTDDEKHSVVTNTLHDDVTITNNNNAIKKVTTLQPSDHHGNATINILCKRNLNESKLNDREPTLGTQVAGTVAGSLIHFSLGCIVGLTGVILPALMKNDGQDLYLDQQEAALFSSLLNVGALIGSVSCGPIMVWVGQRVAMLSFLPVALVGWLILAFSHQIWLLYFARILLGIANGVFGGSAATYVAEISHKSVRGRLTGLCDLFRQFGFLFVYIVGSTNLSWRHTCIVSGCVSTVIPFGVLYFFPNSPRWLATKSRFEEMRNSLLFYRGEHYPIDIEHNEIVQQLQNESNGGGRVMEQVRKLQSSSILKRMLILCLLFFTYQFTGNFSMIIYSATIFQSVDSNINEYTSTIIVGVVRVFGVLSYILVADKAGRRPVLILSLVLASISMGCLGSYFFVDHLGVVDEGLRWIPLFTVAVFVYFTCITEPSLMLLRGELLPTYVRSVGVSVIYVFFFGGAFLVTYLFPLMMNTINPHGTFSVYAADNFIMAIVVFFSIPETRGKSLEDIENLFTKKQ